MLSPRVAVHALEKAWRNVYPQEKPALVIFLHGYGADGNDLIGLSPALVFVGCVALATVPMVWALRPAFRAEGASLERRALL